MAENKDLVTYEDLETFKNKMLDIILNYKGGYYDRNEVYELGDIVFYQKRIYVCIQQTPSDIPPTNTDYWDPIDIAAEN